MAYKDLNSRRDIPKRIRINQYDQEELNLIVNLSGGQEAKVIYDIFKMGVEAWHQQNSVGLGSEQLDLLKQKIEERKFQKKAEVLEGLFNQSMG